MWVIIQAPVVVHSTAVVVVIERTSRSSIIKHMRREEDAAQGRAPCRLSHRQTGLGVCCAQVGLLTCVVVGGAETSR